MIDSSPSYTLDDLFERSIQIENKAASIYRELEKRFAHYPGAAALWKALAADEDVHAQVLMTARQDASPEKLAESPPADVWSAVTRILNLMEQDLLGPIKNLKDAYELAHQLEYSEVNAIFEFLSVDAVPGAVERSFVRAHITAHQKRLADFVENYIGEDWLAVIPR